MIIFEYITLFDISSLQCKLTNEFKKSNKLNKIWLKRQIYVILTLVNKFSQSLKKILISRLNNKNIFNPLFFNEIENLLKLRIEMNKAMW